MLEVESLTVRYGAILAVREVSLSVSENKLVSIVGPNGAGKSTLLSTIAGVHQAASGSIRFNGAAIENRRPEDIAQAGVGLVPEGRGVLGTLSVYENLLLAATGRHGRSAARGHVDEICERFPILGELRDQYASRLSGGEQQQLVIGRALVRKPKLLMLDEPSLGLAPQMVDKVFAVIEELRQGGTTILLVEQQARRAVNMADHAYVMKNGRFALEGTSADLAEADQLASAYLGTAA